MFPGLLDIKINLKPDSHLTQPSQTGKTQTKKKKKCVKSPECCKELSVFPEISSLVLGKMAEKWFS